jgi:hypothetical protein
MFEILRSFQNGRQNDESSCRLTWNIFNFSDSKLILGNETIIDNSQFHNHIKKSSMEFDFDAVLG